VKIPVDQIVPNPEQPRQNFDQDGLKELAQSIREVGVIQPITVEISEDGQTYILHDGERRWRAAQIAGLEEIPAEIVEPLGDDVSRRDRLTRALVANVQREDLSPLEVARAYQRLHDEMGLTDQAIADRVGKSRSAVANARRLLELPEEVQSLAGEEDVSERTLAALLPIYKCLPQDVLDQAETTGYTWQKPSQLLGEIKRGKANSDYVRREVNRIIQNNTRDLTDAIWPLDHPFDANGLKVETPRCDECPMLITVGKGDDKKYRCPRAECFQAKEARWTADLLAEATEKLGIPVLEGDPSYSSVERFYGEPTLFERVKAEGCENLRLKFNKYEDGQYEIVCHHGRGKPCKCLSKLRAERTKTDPYHIAERERKKELQKMVSEYSQVLAAAIAEGNAGVWLRILRAMAYKYNNAGDGWDLSDIQQRMAQILVDNHLPFDAHDRLAVAKEAVNKFFAEMSLPLPGRDDPATELRRRFDRIKGWIDVNVHQIAGDVEGLTLEAVQGNLANLEKITDEFDAISDQHIGNEAFDGFLQDLADAWETLDTLKHELQTNGRVGVQTVEVEHG
jgi:ParB/RepB/Spo0J family partition protein